MRIVLLSGGSGKRLWPLSNDIRSKVFLKLLNSEDGGKESMIQRVCRQLDRADLLKFACIVTHKSQVEITQSHIGRSIPVISEPFKKGTFTAVALAAAYFHSKLNVDPHETVCVLPVDSFVDPDFFHLLKQFPDVLSRSSADIALLGTVPAFPSSQFGYIVPKETGSAGYYAVAQFVEKPEPEKAAALISRQALWNCGVFAFSLEYMLRCLHSKGLPVQYGQLLERYENLPEVSFDHEVAEQSDRSAVIPYQGTWKDLGTWYTLSSHLDSNVTGPGYVSEDSVNTHLVNELFVPVYVIGVSDVIVAASPDGILVAGKDKSSQIKEKLQDYGTRPRPMYEETSWGTCRVLDQVKAENGAECVTRKMNLSPGNVMGCRIEPNSKLIWTVISGSGELQLDGATIPVQTGDVLQIPSGAQHGLKAVTALELIEVQIESGLT